MQGIYIAAIVALLLSMLLVGLILFRKQPKEERKFYILAILLIIPMSAGMYYIFRVPLDDFIKYLFGAKSLARNLLFTFYAPITEEPGKLWPLLIPWFYKKINEKNAVRTGIALGLGFSLGEIILLAAWLGNDPGGSAYPWYAYVSGFSVERIMATFLHIAATTTALYFLAKKRFWLGLLLAVMMHYFFNFPIFLAKLNLFHLGQPVWQTILGIYIALAAVGSGILLTYYLGGKAGIQKIIGRKAKCPGCGQIYKRPWLFALNMLHKRYERCPHCKKWHWTEAITG